MKITHGLIGERGQVVIPKVLRERYHLQPHTQVEFVEVEGELVLRPVVDVAMRDAWDDVRGILRVDDVDADIEEMRGR